jgi:putative YphP/YqiW family bacilliredoxin
MNQITIPLPTGEAFETKQTQWAPTYDQEAVQPMRDELVAVGFEELLTPEQVDKVFTSPGKSTLLVINSVCGCAAGNARPGAMLALQHPRIPDQLTTVFAGQEKLAVVRAREYLEGNPPSSPCIALLRDGKVLRILERRQIEQRDAQEVAQELTRWFDQYCQHQGPSIPADEFEKLNPFRACGSSIPLTTASPTMSTETKEKGTQRKSWWPF